jgi:hypothetical protein
MCARAKSFKLTTLIDFQIDSNMLYNLKNATFLAYGEASMLLSIWKSIKVVSLKLFPNYGG